MNSPNTQKQNPSLIWALFLDYLRQKEIGEEFQISEIEPKIAMYQPYYKTTLFKYRSILEACGYIKHSEGLTFKKVKAIPQMTRNVAMDKAYVKSWKSWFLEEVDPK